MFVFSQVHDWQNDPAVKQILVFSSNEVKDSFDILFATKVAEEGIENASENNLGASYKLRAVLATGEGQWIGVIRDGFCGMHLHESRRMSDTPEAALKIAIEELKDLLANDLDNLANSL
jgi:hypothetical protein